MDMYTVEYQSAVKRGNVSFQVNGWRQKKKIMSVVTQTPKDKYCVFFCMYSYSIRMKLYEVIPTPKFPIQKQLTNITGEFIDMGFLQQP